MTAQTSQATWTNVFPQLCTSVDGVTSGEQVTTQGVAGKATGRGGPAHDDKTGEPMTGESTHYRDDLGTTTEHNTNEPGHTEIHTGPDFSSHQTQESPTGGSVTHEHTTSVTTSETLASITGFDKTNPSTEMSNASAATMMSSEGTTSSKIMMSETMTSQNLTQETMTSGTMMSETMVSETKTSETMKSETTTSVNTMSGPMVNATTTGPPR